MKLTKKGEYALRAMFDLSSNYQKGLVRINEIAEREKIPLKFLEQILLGLKKAGLVQSKRGMGGGYTLNKPPEAITLAQVIRITDGPLAPLGCVSQWAHICCPNENICGLHSVMLGVRNAIVKTLEGVTIADVCKKTKELQKQHLAKKNFHR
jgi:Rrf2 family transcriptional regulator, cysteine metabolism repressor